MHHLTKLPVVKDALWEGLSRGGSSQGSGESEGLDDWQVDLDVVDGGSWPLDLLKDDSSLLVQHRVDSSDRVLRALDLDQVDWLHEYWLSGELSGVHDSPGGWDDLSSSSVDGIGVKHDILNLKGDSSHVLLSERTVLGGPLEGGDDTVLNLIKVLDSLGHIDDQVRSGGVWSEAPNLSGTNVLVPAELSSGVGTSGS